MNYPDYLELYTDGLLRLGLSDGSSVLSAELKAIKMSPNTF